MPYYGSVAGYKVKTFAAGEHDNGPVNGLSGPVTAVMLSKGMLENGAHVSVNCCHMTFVEADFAVEVGSDAINNAVTDLDFLEALNGMRPFIEMPDLLQPAQGSSNVGGIATNYDFRHGIVGDLIPVEATDDGILRLSSFRYQLTNEEGEALGAGLIKDAYEPLKRVRALRDRLQLRGRRLKAGHLVIGKHGDDPPAEAESTHEGPPVVQGQYRDGHVLQSCSYGTSVSVCVHIDRDR